jgi:hypothetical protein
MALEACHNTKRSWVLKRKCIGDTFRALASRGSAWRWPRRCSRCKCTKGISDRAQRPDDWLRPLCFMHVSGPRASCFMHVHR